MDELTKFLVNELIDGKSVTAIYGGGFKPPTKGHFDLVKTALKDFKDIDKFLIYVGGGVRDGIEQEQSLQIWDIYKELLPSKVQIEPSATPIGDILRYAKNHPDEKVYFVLGYREGREDDLQDIISRTKGVEEKYPNLEVRVIKTPAGDMSGTNARKALQKGDKEKFFTYLPTEIPANEKEDIYNILEPNIFKENVAPNHKGKAAPFGSGYKPLKENTIPSIDILEKIAELTLYMREKGYNIDPVPGITIIDNDMDNAEEFLGKTAYYDPINKSITLYTYGRHPKDIVRSYAHEMIHHIQNLEGRLGDITTTNTQEDDHLNDIEAEANLKGTMTFRNWTDSLQEDGQKTSNKNMDDYKKQNNPSGKVKDPFGLNQYARELAQGLEESSIHEVGEGSAKTYDWELLQTNPGDYTYGFTTDSGIEYEVELVTLNYEDDETGEPINGLEIGFGAGEKGKDKSEIEVINRGEIFRVMATIVEIIQFAIKLAPDFKSTNAIIYNPARKKGEDSTGNQRDKLYQAYIKKAIPNITFSKEGTAIVGKFDSLKETSYLHNTGVNENDEEMRDALDKMGGKKPVIFCDMDGVLVDFDEGYKELTGVSTQQANLQGKNEFWDLYRNSLKEKNIPERSYWANLDWMPDGKQLWDFISPYNPYVLTAPSVNFDIPFEERYKVENNESMQGKTEWVQRLPNMRKLYFRAAKRKADFAGPGKILIDDRKDTIDSWNANGGIGILHTSATNTIKQLQDLGL
jgi:PAS domain-containing protein